MFRFLARETYRLRWLWLLGGVIILAVSIWYGVNVFASLKDGGIDEPSSMSAREARLMAEKFPRSRASLVLLVTSKSWTTDQSEFQDRFLQLISKIEKDPSRPSVLTYCSTGSPNFVSRDKHSTFALIGLSGNQDAAYLRIRQATRPADLSVRIGGPVAADYEMNAEVEKDLPRLGAISVPVLAVLLVLIFRSLTAAALPLLIGAMSVLGAFTLTRLVCHFTDISIFAANIISLLGLGLAIDYSLLFVSRFRDELSSGESVANAVATSVNTAGASILLSGMTVALSLLGLLAFPEMFLRSMGIGGAIAVAVAVAASLTILPALLSVLGRKIDWLAIPFLYRRTAQASSRGWRALGTFVVRWPVPVLVASLALVLAAGYPFLHIRFANPGIGSLPEGFAARQVDEAIERDFPNNQTPEIDVLLTLQKPLTSPASMSALNDYVRSLQSLPNVRGVDSLTTAAPPLSADDLAALLDDRDDPRVSELSARYVGGDTTLVAVNYTGGAGDDSTQALVRAIRSVRPPSGSAALVGGETAELVDHLASLRAHLPAAIAIIFFTTFVVLLLSLSSLVIPLKAIALNTLSLSAAFGLMAWIFQEGHLHSLLRFTPGGALDPTLPVLIFAIAFGLATDYEVFLVSRIKEEYERTGNNTEAVVIGVEKTGGIITAAGLLLVVVVAAFGMSDILSMKEMGIGLAIAVFVDAAIVRTLLVPAAMQLFGAANWWLPFRRRS